MRPGARHCPTKRGAPAHGAGHHRSSAAEDPRFDRHAAAVDPSTRRERLPLVRPVGRSLVMAASTDSDWLLAAQGDPSVPTTIRAVQDRSYATDRAPNALSGPLRDDLAIGSNPLDGKACPERRCLSMVASVASRWHRFSAHPSSAHPPSALPPSALPSSAHPSSAHPPSAHPPSAHPPSAHPSSAHPPSAHPPSAHPPSAHPSSAHPSSAAVASSRRLTRPLAVAADCSAAIHGAARSPRFHRLHGVELAGAATVARRSPDPLTAPGPAPLPCRGPRDSSVGRRGRPGVVAADRAFAGS